MKDLYIYGAGGLGKEVLAMVRGMADWSPVAFIDDDPSRQGSELCGLPIVEVIQMKGERVYVAVAIGDPASRASICSKLDRDTRIEYPVLIHPTALILDTARVRIGAGSILTAGCILTTDIEIGRNVLINLGATVGHDCRVGDFSSIMPGVNLAGGARLGHRVLIGSGANLINQVQVGDDSVVGMGAVVLRNIPSGRVAVGVPARIIDQIPNA